MEFNDPTEDFVNTTFDDVYFTAALNGDFNSDGQLTADDIDLLSAELNAEVPRRIFDVNGDARVNGDDRIEWMHKLKGTYFGDSNLDGEFNSGDLIAVFQAGQYEDAEAMNSTWATGDWNGDQEFATG